MTGLKSFDQNSPGCGGCSIIREGQQLRLICAIPNVHELSLMLVEAGGLERARRLGGSCGEEPPLLLFGEQEVVFHAASATFLVLLSQVATATSAGCQHLLS